MFSRITGNILIGLEAISQNMLRGALTSLGIIFGVASVIAMLAIGTGAKNKILEQLRFLGANNIIIMKMAEQEEGEVKDEPEKEVKRFTPGLTLADAHSIENIPGVKRVVPEIVIEKNAIRDGYKRSVKLVGVTNDFFELSAFKLSEGSRFTEEQMEKATSVCIIGNAVKARFFSHESAIGKRIKVGTIWLTVVGVAGSRKMSETKLSGIGIRDYDMDVYTPVKTALLRFTDRARITAQQVKASNSAGGNGMFIGQEADAPKDDKESKNYHQVDRITVTVQRTDQVVETAEVIQRMLQRRHNSVVDFEIHIPEQMLEQEQQTQDTFNFTLAVIAAISLLVGGIGIMNIMLASVMERIKEIGLRLSLGATKVDIMIQFMAEAVSLSVGGGIVGIFVGIAISKGIEGWSDIPTVISPFSILLSFLVSVFVGIIFGFFPARKAAKQDPVISLRHE